MQKSKVRIIVDTNLWISFLISTEYSGLLAHLEGERIALLYSVELLEEILSVTERPKMRKYFTLDNAFSLLRLFEHFGEYVDVKSRVNLSRDPKDNFLLSLAKDGKAHYLLTGDKDLLSLGRLGETEIISYSQFMNALS